MHHKYRAWDKVNKYMWYGDFVIDATDGSIWVAPNKPGDTDNREIERRENMELMQFTGREDINKKPLYEGDVVICHPENKYGRREINIDFYNGFDNGDGGSFELIGNIKENPELLHNEPAISTT